MTELSSSVLAFLKELGAVLLDLGAGVATWSQETALRYLRFLRRSGVVFLVVAAILFSTLLLGVFLRQAWLISISGLFIGIATAALLLLAAPVAAPALYAAEALKPVREAVSGYIRVVTVVLLWTLLASLYLSVVPISNNPKAIVLVLLLASVVALMWARFGIGPSARKIYGSVSLVFVATTVSLFFPKTFGAAGGFRQRLDEKIADCLTNPAKCLASGPSAHRPRAVAFDAIPTLEFFDPSTGAPQYWFHRSDSGEYELFDAPGFHPRTRDSLRVVTPEVATDIMRWYRAREATRPLSSRVPSTDTRVDRVARDTGTTPTPRSPSAMRDTSGASRPVASPATERREWVKSCDICWPETITSTRIQILDVLRASDALTVTLLLTNLARSVEYFRTYGGADAQYTYIVDDLGNTYPSLSPNAGTYLIPSTPIRVTLRFEAVHPAARTITLVLRPGAAISATWSLGPVSLSSAVRDRVVRSPSEASTVTERREWVKNSTRIEVLEVVRGSNGVEVALLLTNLSQSVGEFVGFRGEGYTYLVDNLGYTHESVSDVRARLIPNTGVRVTLQFEAVHPDARTITLVCRPGGAISPTWSLGPIRLSP